MVQIPEKKKTSLLQNSRTLFIEAIIVLSFALFLLFLQYGSIEFKALLSYHTLFTIIASLCTWFVNRLSLDYILQSRIDSNKITKFLPIELTAVSVLVTSIIYIFTFLIFIYLEGLQFVLTDFLQGFALTIGLSLLIGMIYVSSQIWKSWWSDGNFLFQKVDEAFTENDTKDFITIKTSRNTVNFDLKDVLYFISESKIAFLVDTSDKKWITQYNLTELEKLLGHRYFRLNRRILASRQAISKIKKLPNHRLQVTIGEPNKNHTETISRYKSTRFKQWFLPNNQE